MLAFYISGHGFGHAARQIEIINALHRRDPAQRFFVRASVARWLLEHTIEAPFDADDRPCDVGLVQIDALRPDIPASIAAARDFYGERFASAVRQEADDLRKRGVRLVVSDAPPLACAAADAAGLQSIVISNFTWDWIYAGYPETATEAPDLVPTIDAAYRLAREAWRLPMHGGFGSFTDGERASASEPRERRGAGGPHQRACRGVRRGEAPRRIIDVPFVARHARHSRGESRRRLGLPTDTPLALSSFGGYGVSGIDLHSLDTVGTWDVVVTGREQILDPPPGVRFVHESAIYGADLRYEDLVAACEVVVSKPGYGIVSECLANDTALVYTSRGRFVEYDVMVAEMPRVLRCAYISNEDLLAGRWRAALEEAAGAPAPAERPRTDGAEVIADMIAAL